MLMFTSGEMFFDREFICRIPVAEQRLLVDAALSGNSQGLRNMQVHSVGKLASPPNDNVAIITDRCSIVVSAGNLAAAIGHSNYPSRSGDSRDLEAANPQVAKLVGSTALSHSSVYRFADKECEYGT
jgi:hypothetical protein